MGSYAGKEEQVQEEDPSPTDGMEFPNAFDVCAFRFVLQKQAGANCLWLHVNDLFQLAENLGVRKWENLNVEMFMEWLCESHPDDGKVGIELLPRIMLKSLECVTNGEKQIMLRFLRVLAKRSVNELSVNPVTTKVVEHDGTVGIQLVTCIDGQVYESCVTQPDLVEILEEMLAEGVSHEIEGIISSICLTYATNRTLIDASGQVLDQLEALFSCVPVVGTPYFHFICQNNQPRDTLSSKLAGYEWNAKAGETTDANLAKLFTEFGSVNATLAALQNKSEGDRNETDIEG